ncbi:hypothetical protein THF5H11_30124 [Vibrio jasicida]|nr:hypothetical protein THF5H11_30124 [Vibrio jasicida]
MQLTATSFRNSDPSQISKIHIHKITQCIAIESVQVAIGWFDQ